MLNKRNWVVNHCCIIDGDCFELSCWNANVKKIAESQNQSYRLVITTLLPMDQTPGRSKHVRRNECFLSLAQIDKLYYELKW